MSYSQPRDRLELRLKEIIDNEIGDVTDRRTRFDTLLAAVVDPSVVPPDQRDRAELYLSELAGRAGGGITPTGTVTITANGTHNVEQYKYAQVAVPAPTPQTEALSITIGSAGNQIVTYYPGYGKTYSDVTLYRDDAVIAPGNIKKDVVIFGVTGTYAGESVNLQNGSLTLGAAAPTSPLVPGSGYDGFSSVAISVDSSVIKPENIKAGATILGVTGTASGGGTLHVDSRKIAGIPHSQIVTLGWRPDRIILTYVWLDPEYDPDDPDHDDKMTTYSFNLSSDTDITGEGDWVRFTSTGYYLDFEGTGFNDYPDDYSEFVVTAINLS